MVQEQYLFTKMYNPKHNKKKKKADVYVQINFILVVAFVIVMLITFYIKDSIPDSLVDFMKFVCSTEFIGLAWIKSNNIKKGE